MSYGRVSLTGHADSQERQNHMSSENRFQFKRKMAESEEDQRIYGKVCEGCNVRRTSKEFAGVGETFKNCSVCRARGASRETVK